MALYTASLKSVSKSNKDARGSPWLVREVGQTLSAECFMKSFS